MDKQQLKKKSKGESLLDYFSHNKVFKIPEYQRRYKWNGEDNLESLCDSIFSLINDRKKQLFLGTITLKSEPKNEKIILLIDGQQRITTFYILLKVLYDMNKSFNEMNEKFPWEEDIEQELSAFLYLKQKVINESKLKLKDSEKIENLAELINKRDRSVKEVFKKQSQFKSGTNYYKNYFFFLEKIRSWLEDNSVTIREILESLKRIWISTITLDEGDDELAIFESINALGTPLTAMELLKNYFFIKIRTEINIDSEQREEYKKKLTDLFEVSISEVLGIKKEKHEKDKDSKITKFVQKYLNYKKIYAETTTGKSIQIGNRPISIYAAFKKIIERLFNDLRTEDDLNHFILDFNKFLTFFSEIKSFDTINSYSKTKTIISLQNDQFLEQDYFSILMQAAILSDWSFYNNGETIDKKVPKDFKNFITAFHRYLLKKPIIIDGVQKERAFETENKVFDSIGHMISAYENLDDLISTKKYVDIIKSSNNIFETLNQNILKLLLWKIEIHLDPNLVGVKNIKPQKNFVLDCIMPKSTVDRLDKNNLWQSYLNSVTSEKINFDDEDVITDYKKTIESIGNLTITKNKINGLAIKSKINQPFPTKVAEIYRGSEIKLNDDICDNSIWTKRQVSDRTNSICDLIEKSW